MVGAGGLTSYLCLFYKNEQGNTVGDSIPSVIALIGTGRKVLVCLFPSGKSLICESTAAAQVVYLPGRDGRKMISSSKISARQLTVQERQKLREALGGQLGDTRFIRSPGVCSRAAVQ